MIWPITKRTLEGEAVFIQPVKIQPMPDVRRAVVYVPDAISALERAKEAWNKTQLLDAIRSAEHFLAAAKDALADDRAADAMVAREKVANPIPMPKPGTIA
ncbi:hypothetical protein [Massilia varians]|uniref:hypothetical protein n=1 Tax=Massilia varians TaxID=457921 RepID=UPI002556B152|nr:hypothetical protein [Massilia varians]MDK6078962.1 hypothetical protein [Massilia varians]